MTLASLGELVTLAETETVALLGYPVTREDLAPAWQEFTRAAARALIASMGSRANLNPADQALHDVAHPASNAAMRPAPPTRTPRVASPRTDQVRRIAALLDAIADLQNTKPITDPELARHAGARTAAILGACSHVAVTASGPRDLEPISLDALQLETASVRVIDDCAGNLTLGSLADVVAGPVTAPPSSVGERYQAAALAWRRPASDDTAPSQALLRQSAQSIAHGCLDVWHVVRAAPPINGSDEHRELLARAGHVWQAVADAWADLRTPGQPTLQQRMAAIAMAHASRDIRVAAAERGAADVAVAVIQGFSELSQLGNAHLALTRRLGSVQQIYIKARDLPDDDANVEAILHNQWVTAPPIRLRRLLDPYGRAIQQTIEARRTATPAIDLAFGGPQPPELANLIVLARRPRPLAL